MFILWYSASSTFGKDSDIVMGVRAQQKKKTRRSLVEAAFSQLSAERSFASLSLREVAREAGIAPTSFYRHFRDVDELGLTMVDESGLMLRQLMRQARQRIAKGCHNSETAPKRGCNCRQQAPNAINRFRQANEIADGIITKTQQKSPI